ncbi:MAG: BMP family ABC transporter substrate-binding protein [Spirochaetia bacterium]
MKKRVVFLLLTGLVLFSCQTASHPDTEAKADSVEKADQSTIAVLLPTADGAEPMAEEAMIGINRLVQEFNGTLIKPEDTVSMGDGPVFEVLTTPSGNAPDKVEAITRDLREFGLGRYDLVIGVGFHYIDPFGAICDEYPDTDFVGLDFVLEVYRDNLTSLEWDMRDVAFMAGAVAAERFAGKTVGAIGGMELGFIREDFLDPFIAGVRYMDEKTGSETEVIVDYVGSFNDPERAYALGAGMFDRGASLIYEVAGDSGTGVHRAGAQADELIIAVDTDRGLNAALAGEQHKHFLTSTVKRWDEGVYLAGREYLLTGSLPKGNQIVGMAEKCAELAVNPYNTPLLGEQLETIGSLKEKLLSGKIDASGEPSREEVWRSVKAPAGAEIITIAQPELSPDLPNHYGGLLREALFTEFLSSGGYKVLSREHLDSLVGEIKFSLDGLSDEKYSLEVGRLAAAEGMVFVNLSTLGDSLSLNCTLVEVETGLAVSAVRQTYPDIEAAVDDLGNVVFELSTP